MFYTVPLVNSDFSFNTPIGAKSLVGYFFEYKKMDAINSDFEHPLMPTSKIVSPLGKKIKYIDVGGRIIFKNCIITPFMPDVMDTQNSGIGYNRYRIEDVFIPVNINVCNTEIKISGFSDNYFNIVFIFSDKPVKKEWYLFFEEFSNNPYENKNHFLLSNPPDLFFFFGTTMLNVLSHSVRKSYGYFVDDIKQYKSANINLKGDNYWFDQPLNLSLATITSNNSWKKVKLLSPHKDYSKNISVELTNLPERLIGNIDNPNIFWKNAINYYYFFGYKKS